MKVMLVIFLTSYPELVFCKAAVLTICYSGRDFFKLPSQLKPPQEAVGLGTFMSVRVLNLRALGSGREAATTR